MTHSEHSHAKAEIDLDAMEWAAKLVDSDPKYGTMVIIPAELLALIQRLRDAEALAESNRLAVGANVEKYVAARARIAQLERGLGAISDLKPAMANKCPVCHRIYDGTGKPHDWNCPVGMARAALTTVEKK